MLQLYWHLKRTVVVSSAARLEKSSIAFLLTYTEMMQLASLEMTEFTVHILKCQRVLKYELLHKSQKHFRTCLKNPDFKVSWMWM